MKEPRYRFSPFTHAPACAAAAAVIAFGAARHLSAASLEDPSGTISTVSTGATNTYAIKVSDASDAAKAIGTVWFAWVPGKDFLATQPTAESSPAGWSVTQITHAGSSDGYAIQWEAGSAANDIPIGGSLSGFGFSSADSPASVDGNSLFYPGTPVLTTVVYDSIPFTDADTGTHFVISAVPEPASLAGVLLPAGLLLRRRRMA